MPARTRVSTVRPALFGLNKIYRSGFAYKKAGMMLKGIGGSARLAPAYAWLWRPLEKINAGNGRPEFANTISVFSSSSPKP